MREIWNSEEYRQYRANVAAPGGEPVGAGPRGPKAIRDRPAAGQAWIFLPTPEGRPSSGLPASLRPILGRSPLQRHVVHLARLGVERCVILLPTGTGARELERECRQQTARLPVGRMGIVLRPSKPGDPDRVERAGEGSARLLLVRGDGVYDPRLYRHVWDSPVPGWLVDGWDERSAADSGTWRPIGLARADADALPVWAEWFESGSSDPPASAGPRAAGERWPVDEVPTYVSRLRRHLRPYWRVLCTTEDRARAERSILDSAQKGVLDFPARFFHPIPENFLVRWAARTPVTPNQITVFTGLVAFVATYLFAAREFGWGLAIAFLVNVLDGVDGKLARVRLQESRYGDRLDHLLDVTFEFSWYVALGWGVMRATGQRTALWAGLGLVAVMAASRGVSGLYKWITGRQIHDHRAFDRAFRLVAGRRNIYTVMFVFGLAAGRLEEALYAGFGWGVATLTVYVVRTVVALGARSKPLPGLLRA